MPKIKTHSGLKKVLNKRKNDYKIGKPGSIHNTGFIELMDAVTMNFKEVEEKEDTRIKFSFIGRIGI